MDWDQSEDTKLIVQCRLTPEMSEFTQHAKDWARIAEETLDAIMQDTFLKKVFQLPREVFQEIYHSNKLQNTLQLHSDISDDPVACCYTLVGFASDVQRDIEECAALGDDVKSKQTVKSDSVSLSAKLDPFECWLLRVNDFEATVKSKYPQLDATVGTDDVQFHGLEGDINLAKVLMYEGFVKNQKKREYSLPPVVLKLLKTQAVRDIVQGLFGDANIRVAWETGESHVKLAALSQTDVDKAKKTLEKVILQTRVMNHDEESNCHEVLKLETWQEMKRQLESDYSGLLAITEEDRNVVITCVAEICDKVKKEIQQFITENVVVEQLIPMESMLAQAVGRLCKDDIGKIRETWHSCCCYINISNDPDRPGVLVKGSSPYMSKIMRDVKMQRRRWNHKSTLLTLADKRNISVHPQANTSWIPLHRITKQSSFQ